MPVMLKEKMADTSSLPTLTKCIGSKMIKNFFLENVSFTLKSGDFIVFERQGCIPMKQYHYVFTT